MTNQKHTNHHSVSVDGKTMPEAYLRRATLSPEHVFATIKQGGHRQAVTWGQVHAQVLGLHQTFVTKLGLKPGDSVCIYSQSRPEWTIADLAVLCSGMVTVPIYYSSSIEDVAFILEHCEAKLVVVEDEGSCQKLKQAYALNKKELPVIAFFDPEKSSFAFPCRSYQDAIALPDREQAEASLKASVARVQPQDTASIVYTSGTTGRPKGALLVHSNFTSEVRAVIAELPITMTDGTLTFLPFPHIFGRVESFIPVFSGLVLNFAENITTVAKDIGEVGPTFLASVPRIYEKIYSKIQSEVQAQPEAKRKIFAWAVGVGREHARLLSERANIPLSLAVKNFVANKLVFAKIRQKLGGKIRMTVSGGAPLAKELCEFFHACQIKILEGYGLTETTAAITVNRPDDYAFGTVGKPLPGMEIRIAEDGEIQARGPMIFKEYYRDAKATEECFTADKWFCTGDIGEITDRGMVRITDRKKELIVTSGGKKIAPQKLENLLKGSRFVSNCMVYGDKQKFIIALITINEPEVSKWAKEKGLTFADCTGLCKLKEVNELFEQEMRNANRGLASYESLKKVSLLPADFTVETGELTPSLKVKRKVVVEKYAQVIGALYGSGGET